MPGYSCFISEKCNLYACYPDCYRPPVNNQVVMISKSFLLAGVLASAMPVLAMPPADTVRLAEFGAKAGSYEDALPAFNRAIAACKQRKAKVLLLEPGRYDIWPEHAAQREYFISNTSSETECPSKWKKIGLHFEKMENLEVKGEGVLLMFHGKMITWAFDSCRNMRLEGIAVDFERPSMSEMTILAAGDSVVDARIHPASSHEITANRLKWYGEGWGLRHFHAIRVQPSTKTWWYDDWRQFDTSRAQEMPDGAIRFQGDFRKRKFVPGDIITVRDPIRDHVGAFIRNSSGIHLKGVRMHYMHGLGIIAQFSENLHYENVVIAPREGSGRVIAAFADCTHFSGCRGQILIENCRFNGAHDDLINVHGTHLQVVEKLSPTKVRLRFMHHQAYGFPGFYAGDSTALLDAASLKIYAHRVVTSAKLVSEREMEVTFSAPLPADMKTGDAIENTTWTPALTVRNCQFGGTNARGILVTTRRKVLIERNVFYRTGMHAILIANDANGWFESGPVEDVTIRHNEFIECAYNNGQQNYTISIEPEIRKAAANYYVHRNIRITDNQFAQYDHPVLFVRSTEGLTFSGNMVRRTALFPVSRKRPNIVLENCRHVKIADNKTEGFERLEVKE